MRSELRPALVVWMILILLTIVSWFVGTDLSSSRILPMLVLGLAFVKCGLIILYFMEVRKLQGAIRRWHEIWVLLVGSLVVGLYYIGAG